MNHDWSHFTKRINVNAASKKLYSLWTTRENLEHWFLREASFSDSGGRLREPGEQIAEGDDYLWRWHGYPDTTFEKGKVLRADGSSFHFTFGGPVDSPIIVEVSFPVEDGVSIVNIHQRNIPTDEASIVKYHLGCMEGWTFYLVNLKSLVEGGIDLRCRDERLQRLVNK